jgi:trehalose 6-phosphate phosphatase
MAVSGASGSIAELIAPMREAPDSSAVLCDIDGTLAPIVGDPEEATVPAETRSLLSELARRFALVGCISGRPAMTARAIVGVDALTYAGNHGLELLEPGASDPILDPLIADRADATRAFVDRLDPSELQNAELRLEDKGPIQALHWRGAADEAAAQRLAEEIADDARAVGLEPHWGRKVVEIRPVAGIDKGSAVRRLISGHRIDRALFAGDDRTDLDAFRALSALVRDGALHHAACIGVSSDEAPPELSHEADALVDGTEGFVVLLRELAGTPAGATAADG